MRYLVDTLDFRVADMNELELLDFLGLLELEIPWQQGNNFNGYISSIYFNGIKIGFGGQKGFNCYVHFSGTGCRTFEDLRPGLDWYYFMIALRSDPSNIHIARLDIACDETDNYLRLDRLERYYFSGRFSSRCKNVIFTKGSEEICYIGSPQSDVRLRIYNKKLERGYVENDLDGRPWHRAELQFRDESASSFIDAWVDGENLGIVFCGRIREHCRFLQKPNFKDGNQKRIAEARFWTDFCNDAERIKFAKVSGSDYNKNKLHNFCYRISASSIRTLILSENLSPEQLWSNFSSESIKLRSDQQVFIARSLNKDV